MNPLLLRRKELSEQGVEIPIVSEEFSYSAENEIEGGMEDFFQTTLEDIDDFEQKSWAKGEGYKIPNFPLVEERLEGLESGLYLFAAESNVGKSAVMMNILKDICSYAPNKLFGIYYSLDDSKNEIIPRVIAMDQMIPISVCSKPMRFQKLIEDGEENSATFQEWLDKRKQGLQNLKNCNNLFKIEDSSKIRNAEELYDHMLKVQTYVKALDPQNNIIVAIDAVNDVKIEGNFNNNESKHAEIARTIKQWTVDLECAIFGSIHLRKLNQNRRPTLDDLKESGTYVYEASLVWLLHNDVSKNKQAAKIYSNQPGIEDKCPIIEMDWAKNKKSSYKGRTYGYFTPQYSKVSECSKEASQRFDALIYTEA